MDELHVGQPILVDYRHCHDDDELVNGSMKSERSSWFKLAGRYLCARTACREKEHREDAKQQPHCTGKKLRDRQKERVAIQRTRYERHVHLGNVSSDISHN